MGKWKTTFQLTYLITGLVWLTFSHMEDPGKLGGLLEKVANPDGWLMPISLWISVALTVISGWNYLWSGRGLLKSR